MSLNVTFERYAARPSTSASESSAGKLTFYPFIEGLRGLCALYVVMFHIYDRLFKLPGAPFPALAQAAGIFQYGHLPVAIFIVISGYCLGAPVTKRFHETFDVGMFLRRRARRLLPAYFLALGAGVAIIFIEHVFLGMSVSLRYTVEAVGLHVALLQNLFRPFMFSIDAPMWTIALECQIYILFALMLVPIWKRFGPLAQIGAALALGLLPQLLWHGRLNYLSLWLVALFGMGVAASGATEMLRRSKLWPLASILLGIAGGVLMFRTGDPGWQSGLIIGVSAALFLGCCAAGHFADAVRLLSLPPITGLGAYSYSLYLVHGPLVGLTALILLDLHAPGVLWLAAYAILIPFALAVAYGLYVIAERPNMSAALRGGINATVKQTVTAPVIEVAVS